MRKIFFVLTAILVVVSATATAQTAPAVTAVTGPTPEQLTQVWGSYQTVMGYLGPIFGGGIVALVAALIGAYTKLKAWEKAADGHIETLVKGIGGDLAAVAEQRRAGEIQRRRRIVLVGEEAPVNLWGKLCGQFANVQARSYEELKGGDVGDAILVAVPKPSAEEKDARGQTDFAPAAARLETFMASIGGKNFPDAVMVIGGYLPRASFDKQNEAGVLTSQSPGRLAVDLDFLVRKAA